MSFLAKAKFSKSKFWLTMIILIIAVAGFSFWRWENHRLYAYTDMNEYSRKGILQVNIENNLSQTICFSSCYPYYLQEKKNGVWKNLSYGECSYPDLSTFCIGPNSRKGFGIDLFSYPLEASLSRLALPMCMGCKDGDIFFKDGIFYSNQFKLK